MGATGAPLPPARGLHTRPLDAARPRLIELRGRYSSFGKTCSVKSVKLWWLSGAHIR